MNTYQTPGVYIVEKNAFPNSVVEAATAVPAFIGYTEQAISESKSLINKPFRICSMAEYEQYFGKAPQPDFSLVKTDEKNSGIFALKDLPLFSNGTTYSEDAEEIEKSSRKLSNPTENDEIQYYDVTRNDKFNMYYQLLLFFANGGGSCYIVSVGEGYTQKSLSYDALAGGIDMLLEEQEPTMVVIPEAVYLSEHECFDLQMAMVNHCGNTKKRIAILDIYNGHKSRKDKDAGDVITKFRENINGDNLCYAAAYYPWLNTSVLSEESLEIKTISDTEVLKTIIKTEAFSQKDNKKSQQLLELSERITTESIEDPTKSKELHKSLIKNSFSYSKIIKEIAENINLLPPSAAMAGIYTLVDSTREVWKAPANIQLSNVISPAVSISSAEQEDLNVPMDGKSINAIRSFPGQGILIWGARTLAGNSLEWKYINVRRTMIMLEESIKYAAKAYIFEPNTSETWVCVRSMIINFLMGIWKRGGLAGAVPDDAYSVTVGLGQTMTANDILEGNMIVTVLVALVKPAEFIEITFLQQMQKS